MMSGLSWYYGYQVPDLAKPPSTFLRTHWCLECFCTQHSTPDEPCWQCGGNVLTDTRPENLQAINGPRMYGEN